VCVPSVLIPGKDMPANFCKQQGKCPWRKYGKILLQDSISSAAEDLRKKKMLLCGIQ
jgi:hypothetical protein